MEEKQLTKQERRTLAKEIKTSEKKQQITYDRLKKLFVSVFGIFLITFIGYKIYKWIKTPEPQVAGEAVEATENDWIKGNQEAQVTLIEYSDFQCPACKVFSELVNELSQEFPDDLRIIYRHFPLVSNHQNAFAAGRTSEAAGKQGKFWEMHDILFEKQEEWAGEKDPQEKFLSYAKELGLNTEDFMIDYAGKETEARVNSDLLLGSRLRLNSTPTFFLNARKISPRGYDEMKKLVEEAISEQD